MLTNNKVNTSSLTLFDPEEGSILGELTDAQSREEKSGDGINYVMSGLASDGTLESIKLFQDQGRDTVRYEYINGEAQVSGEAFLLVPAKSKEPSGTEVTIETPTKPSSLVSSV